MRMPGFQPGGEVKVLEALWGSHWLWVDNWRLPEVPWPLLPIPSQILSWNPHHKHWAPKGAKPHDRSMCQGVQKISGRQIKWTWSMIDPISFLSSPFSYFLPPCRTSAFYHCISRCLADSFMSVSLLFTEMFPHVDPMDTTSTPSNGYMTKRGFPLRRHFLTTLFSIPTCCTSTVKGIKSR